MGWRLVEVFEDAGASGKALEGRPGLAAALELVEAGEAAVLVASKLDRISRFVVDFAKLMQRSQKRGWALVALDLGVDTSTPSGKLVANVMASVTEWERDVIGQRTRDALAVKRGQGVKLGRPRTIPPDVVARIRRWRRRGLSLPAIAAKLNETGTPTVQPGARWHPSTARAVLVRR